MKPFLCITIWAALSVSLSLYNKWILSYRKFNFPVLLAFLHMLGASVVFQNFSLWKRWRTNDVWPRPSVTPNWPIAALIAVLFSMSICMRNSAVAELPLSFVQLLASLSPMCTYVLSVAFGFTKLRTRVFLSLSACAFGVWFGLSGSLRASWHGIAMQATGMFLQILQAVLLQKLMAGEERVKGVAGDDDDNDGRKAPMEMKTAATTTATLSPGTKINKIRPSNAASALSSKTSIPSSTSDRPSPAETLAVYAPYCTAVLFFPMCTLELERALVEMTTTRSPLFGLVIAGNVVVALALNLAVATCIHRSSAMTLSLSGLAKDWTVVAASNVLFGKEITLNFIIGMAIVSGAMVSYASSASQEKSSPESLKDVVTVTCGEKEQLSKIVLRGD